MENAIQNAIIIGVLVLIVGLAIFYIVKEKKKGRKCIGCPASGSCSKCKCSSSVSDAHHEETTEEK